MDDNKTPDTKQPSANDLMAKAPEQPKPMSLETVQKKKSPLLAILLVVFILAVIAGTGGYLYYTQSQSKEEALTALPTPIPTSVPLFLTIDSPAEDTKVVNGEVLVAGETLPNTTVSIVTDNDDIIIESDRSGMFETTVLMDETGGLIQITAFDSEGMEKSATYQLTGGGL